MIDGSTLNEQHILLQGVLSDTGFYDTFVRTFPTIFKSSHSDLFLPILIGSGTSNGKYSKIN
jgi:hypothetical protein